MKKETKREMKGAEVLVESLKEEGVKDIFGYPGGATIDIHDAIYRQDKIRFILTRHEQGAAHAAEGYARASGKMGVCMATSGPGATNLVTGVADAYMDSVPILAITGQVPTFLIGNDAFQEADLMGLMMPITKHNFQPGNAGDIPLMVAEAFKVATTGRPGPVHIDIPKDTQQELIKSFRYVKNPHMRGYNPPSGKGHEKQVKKAVDMMTESRKPVLLIGGGVMISNASEEIIALAEALGMPVASTLMAKGGFPETHELSLGMVGMHGTMRAAKAITNADLLVVIGCRFSDRITGNTETFARKAKIIHIDIDSAEIGKNVAVDLPVVGNAKTILKGIKKELESRKVNKNKEWLEQIRRWKKQCPCNFRTSEGKYIKPQFLMQEIQNIIDDRTIIVTEVGQCEMWAAHFLQIDYPRKFIASGGLGTMGFGFPAAIGAKAARPDNTVIDIAGDGSFTMVCQELATTVENNIPVMVVIMRNNFLGMVKQWQDLFYENRRAHTDLGKSIDFVKLAESFGAKGIRVTKPSGLAKALEWAKKEVEKTSVVVEVWTDPEEHILPMMRPGGTLEGVMRCKQWKD